MAVVQRVQEFHLRFIINKKGIFTLFIFFIGYINSQVIIRNSDNKLYQSVTVVNQNKKIVLFGKDIPNYTQIKGDMVSLENKLMDFSINKDTLFIFDKTNVIEEVQITNVNNSNKFQKKISNKKQKNAFVELFPRNHLATYVRINTAKRTFIKSIILFPNKTFDASTVLTIKILDNINGTPNIENPLIDFKTIPSKLTKKKLEVQLPKIVKYPKEGVFISLYLDSEKTEKPLLLYVTSETKLLGYYPLQKKWQEIAPYGYRMNLKVLQ